MSKKFKYYVVEISEDSSVRILSTFEKSPQTLMRTFSHSEFEREYPELFGLELKESNPENSFQFKNFLVWSLILTVIFSMLNFIIGKFK